MPVQKLKNCLAASILLCAALVSASQATDSTKSEPEANSQTLKARVMHLQSQSGTSPRLARPGLPVSTMTPSEAAGQGKQKPEDLLKARVLHAAGLRPQEGQNDKRSPYEWFKLSSEELKSLSRYDISVLIDCSGSMSRIDCVSMNSFIIQEKISRWKWCQEQTALLAQQVATAFPAGITVVPFATRVARYANVHPSTISKVFGSLHPAGATRLDAALGMELDHYFKMRKEGKNQKPLMIAIITDGVPNRPGLVLEQLARVTELSKPNEIRVVFFLIGDADNGHAFMKSATRLKDSIGARFELANGYTFAEVSELGLPRSLAKSVKDLEGSSF